MSVRQALLPCNKLHAPDSDLATDVLTCAYAAHRVVGQLARSHALVVYAHAVFAKSEVKICKAVLAAVGGQVGGVDGDDVQEETGVGIALLTGSFEIRQTIAAQIHIEVGLGDGCAVVAGEDAVVKGLRGGAGCQVNVGAPLRIAGRGGAMPGSYAGDGVVGQEVSADALVIEETEIVGKPEVPVFKVRLCPGR